ncbi:nickel-dependent hydrogenase large subunit, partial [Sulfurimonas sp. NWX79]|uniref:nickel-dependent hydrogenase large subunit n=1 Tax=Sulfurimonas sp. NWX79 TaxID=2925412 RepID=UPI003204C3B0
NLSILSETLQSDLRQHYLMFMVDFAHKFYEEKSFYTQANELYAPFKGKFAKSTLQITKDVLKVVAILGGQWPHTSHIVPGGVASANICKIELFDIRNHLIKTQKYLEEEIYLTSIGAIQNLKTVQDLEEYIQKYPDSQVAIFSHLARECKLDEIGKTGYGYLSYGNVDDPQNPINSLIKAGVYSDGTYAPIEAEKITEDVAYSWYEKEKPLHPSEGKTVPKYAKDKAYSWTKAPRYANKPLQTGPLAEYMVEQDNLFIELEKRYGDSVYVRQLARLLRPAKYIAYMLEMTEEAVNGCRDDVYISPKKKKSGTGFGLTSAARGALGHWIEVENGKIARYQIISPTTWNGSPKDADGNYGAWEKALIGLNITDTDNPMELGHVIRSFDPCLVCTVHSVDNEAVSYKIGF